MSQHPLPPRLENLIAQGGLFEGKYRLIRRLGEGSFATVIHAEHEAMGRDVALKFLRPDVLKAHPEVGQRFLMEVKLASRLTNPYTVTIFDFGKTEEGLPFMVLEYVKGKTLDVAIEKHGALGLKRSLKITLQILESLAEAHSKNIIHRDLKPANLMVGRGPDQDIQIKVLDFGVAKLVEKAEEQLKTSSGRQSTQFIGTPRYMSPEQILGQKVSPASDLYSLGLILYEMATGKASIPVDNVAKVAQLHLDDRPLPLAAIDQLPRPIAAIIRRATARKVDQRYQNAHEFQTAVEAAIEEGKSRNQRAHTQATSPPPPQDPSRSRTSDVFAGKAYVEHPEVDRDILRAQSNPSVTPVSPSAPTPPSSSPSPHVSRQRTSSPPPRSNTDSLTTSLNSGLELDLDPVRQTERDRLRRERLAQRTSTRIHKNQRNTDLQRWFGALLVIALTSGFSFYLLGALLSALSSPFRIAAALLPLCLSLVWSLFSPNAYPDLLHHRFIPWAKRSAAILAILLLTLGLFLPDVTAEALTQDALWFTEPFSDSQNPGTLLSFGETFGHHLGNLFEQIARLLPWT